MAGRLLKIGLLLMLLSLAGCFRPAADGIEPTSNQGQPTAAATNTPARPTQQPTEAETEEANTSNISRSERTEQAAPAETDADIGAGDGEATPTFPPITVIPPTRVTAESSPVDTEATALPATSPTFITPDGPPLPIATDPPPSTPTGGAFTSTPSGLITPTDLVDQSDECVYTVQPGDSVFRIATDRGLTVEELQAVNPDLTGSAPIIYPGDQITLPNCGTPMGDSPDAGTPEPTTISAPPGGQVYEVQPGDTLVNIAEEFGVTVEAIVAANNLADPDRLDVGQQLVIPPPGA